MAVSERVQLHCILRMEVCSLIQIIKYIKVSLYLPQKYLVIPSFNLNQLYNLRERSFLS